MVLNKKNNKLRLLIILISIFVVIIILIIYFTIYKKESFEDFTDEVLLQEPLNDIYTIDINTNNNHSIPKNIYLTWQTSNIDEMHPNMKKSIELLKKVNNDCFVYIFDNDQCYNFLKKYFKSEVADAFNNLIPGAYKADLWRYCILYKYGGIYQDIKYQPIKGFKYSDLLFNDMEYYVRDCDKSGSGVYNAILICKPNNQILLKCINKIIDNSRKKYYGKSPLEPTGPLLMKNFFTTKEINNLELYLHYENNNNTIIYKTVPILKMYDEYRNEQKNNKYKYISYYDLWSKKNIYHH
jgi:mannosyltransferase OCH1-like enzyme